MSDIPTLYIVPTPIGNLADITQRALDVLRSVDLVAAEDTRHTGILLSHYQISVPTFALHDHNEQQKADVLIARIKEGKSVALVSDAGTPLISDPGYHLVTRCREAGVKVVPLPGPCAAITALSAAGLPTDRFAFEGFLPAKAKGREGQMLFVGIDALPGLDGGRQAVADGKLSATFIYPTGGKEAVDVAEKIFKGEKVPKKIVLPTAMITKENVKEYLK